MTDVLVPRSLEEAPVAGGTGLMVEVNAGRVRPPALLDLSRVDEPKAWEPVDASIRVPVLPDDLLGLREPVRQSRELTKAR